MEDPNRAPRRAYAEEHRAHVGGHLGELLSGIARLIFAIAFTALVIYAMMATSHAVPFDSDGVRCYDRLLTSTCLKTAEPAR